MKTEVAKWTPTRFELYLDNGLPFSYSNVSLSTISDTEALEIEKNKNKDFCIVCGLSGPNSILLERCLVVPYHEKVSICSYLYLDYFSNILNSGSICVIRD